MIAPGQKSRLRVRFPVSRAVASGRLLANDEPAAGYTLAFRAVDGRFLKSTRCDASGRYEVRGLPAAPFLMQYFDHKVSDATLFELPSSTSNSLRVTAPARGLEHRIDFKALREGEAKRREDARGGVRPRQKKDPGKRPR